MKINESASIEVAMHQQAREACQTVMQYINDHEPYREITLGNYGDYYVYLSRAMRLDDAIETRGQLDFLLLIGQHQPNTYGMSGALMNLGTTVFGCDQAIIIYGMRQDTLDEMRRTVNSTSFIQVFQHEFLHLLDRIRTKGQITTKTNVDPHNQTQYYNDPAEFNAYYHDIATEMLEVIHYAETDPENVADYMNLYGLTGDWRRDIPSMLTKNLMTRRFTTSLTPDRRRALMRRLYRLHQRMIEVVHAHQ